MIKESVLAEAAAEARTTRKLLERLPEDRFDWKPHAKSMTLRQLATHTANLLRWAGAVVSAPEFDLASADAATRAPQLSTREDVLAHFDESLHLLQTAVEAVDDEAFLAPWTLKKAGHVIATAPRLAMYRSFVLNHHIHHRGQLSVYLRCLDVPLPAMYGPSADEGGF